DEAEAVAPQLQAVRAIAEAVLARVEGVLAGLLRGRVAVGDHHLGEGRPVEHRAIPAAVAVAEVVQGQPLAGVEPDDPAPVLPPNLVAVHRETGAPRLRACQRTAVLAG